jgi:hypothetical protein
MSLAIANETLAALTALLYKGGFAFCPLLSYDGRLVLSFGARSQAAGLSWCNPCHTAASQKRRKATSLTAIVPIAYLAPERFAEGDWIILCGGRRVYLLLSTPGHGLTRVASVVLSVWLALIVHAVDDASLLPNSSQ